VKLAELLPKLECGTKRGCGSKDMVLFPWKERPTKTKSTAGAPAAAELPF